MRLSTTIKVAALGAGVVMAVLLRQKRGGDDATRAWRKRDVTQDLTVELGDEAVLQAIADLEAVADGAEGAAYEEIEVEPVPLVPPGTPLHDTGELYGMHTPRAVDRELPDDDDAFEHGENWLEALGASATEFGAEPERALSVFEEDEAPVPRSDRRDTPVADHGSAGPRGV